MYLTYTVVGEHGPEEGRIVLMRKGEITEDGQRLLDFIEQARTKEPTP